MNVLIFGGGFNPITIGHIRLFEKLKSKYDEIWIIPCYKHNFNKDMLPFEQRFEMCKLIEKDNVKICDIEKQYEINNTYDLIMKLKELHPKNKYSFLIGLDNANCIEKWYKYEELLTIIKFIVFGRTGVEIKSNWFKQKPHKFIKQEVGDISSTLVRQIFNNNYLDPLAKEYLDVKIYDHIIINGLYRKEK